MSNIRENEDSELDKSVSLDSSSMSHSSKESKNNIFNKTTTQNGSSINRMPYVSEISNNRSKEKDSR